MKPIVLAAAATAAPAVQLAAYPAQNPHAAGHAAADRSAADRSPYGHRGARSVADAWHRGRIFVVSALALIFLLAIQTTKQEGLTGTIGGRVESDFRGRLGAEEQLKRVTGVTAVVFVITAFVLSLTGI